MIEQAADLPPGVGKLHKPAATASQARHVECSGPDWTVIVRKIQDGEDEGMEELYRVFSRGIRFYLCRQLGTDDLDDKVHDTFLIVVQAIQRGELREPERLMGFVRTVVRRQVAAYIDRAVHRRRDEVEMDTVIRLIDIGSNPEVNAIARQRVDLARSVLDRMTSRDREILSRFYLREQTQEQICREMHLTGTQFRLLKSRAKSRFAEIGQRRLDGGIMRSVMLQVARTRRIFG
jgi:RNA polymerase sigma-70 factor (ECF subfamily)